MFLINAFAAAVIIDPLFGDDYPEVAPDGSTIDWPLLVGGYAVIAVAIGWLHRHEPRPRGWVERGLGIGLPVGVATFAGVHLVQAGYTTIDNTAWVLSGLLDIFDPIAASLVVARIAAGTLDTPMPATRLEQELDGLNDPDRVDANLAHLETVAATINRHLDRLRQQRSSNAR